MSLRDADVVVVGAGLAGLTAALDVHHAGRDVVVLEARDRVGGRTLNAEIGGGEVVEMGGEWIGPSQHHIAALARELAVETFPTYYEGEHLARIVGVITRHPEPFPTLSAERQVALDEALHRLQGMAAAVPVDAPWDAPDAAELDTTTFDAWLRANIGDPETRDLVGIVAEVQATPAAELSLLWALYSIDRLQRVRRHGERDRRRAAGPIRRGLAAGLDQGRGALGRGRRPGSTGEVDPHDVDRCHRSVRSLGRPRPPCDRGRPAGARCAYRVEPALPADKDADPHSDAPGLGDQVNVVYDEPFWREDGLSGQWTDPSRALTFGLDNSPPGGRPGVLVGFFEAASARRFARVSREERRQIVIDSLVGVFGPRAKDPNEVLELDWSTEPWTRGCYAGKPAVGAAVAFGRALRRADGPIHWASAETATMWHGYLDGAVSSGHRAAREVLETLG